MHTLFNLAQVPLANYALFDDFGAPVMVLVRDGDTAWNLVLQDSHGRLDRICGLALAKLMPYLLEEILEFPLLQMSLTKCVHSRENVLFPSVQ